MQQQALVGFRFFHTDTFLIELSVAHHGQTQHGTIAIFLFIVEGQVQQFVVEHDAATLHHPIACHHIIKQASVLFGGPYHHACRRTIVGRFFVKEEGLVGHHGGGVGVAQQGKGHRVGRSLSSLHTQRVLCRGQLRQLADGKRLVGVERTTGHLCPTPAQHECTLCGHILTLRIKLAYAECGQRSTLAAVNGLRRTHLEPCLACGHTQRGRTLSGLTIRSCHGIVHHISIAVVTRQGGIGFIFRTFEQHGQLETSLGIGSGLTALRRHLVIVVKEPCCAAHCVLHPGIGHCHPAVGFGLALHRHTVA